MLRHFTRRTNRRTRERNERILTDESVSKIAIRLVLIRLGVNRDVRDLIMYMCLKQEIEEIEETILKRQIVGNGETITKRHIVGLGETTKRDQELYLVQRYRRSLNPNYRELPIMGPQLTKKGIKRARYLQQFYPKGQTFRIAKYNT